MMPSFRRRGSQQIRTAVDGFADRYLATRSGNHCCLYHRGRGSQQIRTAVDGFADRYLATRSGNHFRFVTAKVQLFFKIQTICAIFRLFSCSFAVSPLGKGVSCPSVCNRPCKMRTTNAFRDAATQGSLGVRDRILPLR